MWRSKGGVHRVGAQFIRCHLYLPCPFVFRLFGGPGKARLVGLSKARAGFVAVKEAMIAPD